MSEFHFIRPWGLLCLLPWFILMVYSLRKPTPESTAWASICDNHLLVRLLQYNGQHNRNLALMILFSSALFMIIALSGPSWSRFPVPTYKQNQPRVILLDLSDTMLVKDPLPNRLTRAKFKLHDLFKHEKVSPVAMVVYTGEPFVLSPLTDDAKTIDALLSSLTPDIMPVGGQRLDDALFEASQLISQGGFSYGQILVLTATPPSYAAIKKAKELSLKQITTSVMPIVGRQTIAPFFQSLAEAGQGLMLPMTEDSSDLERWLNVKVRENPFLRKENNNFPVWRDEGRWFLIPALIFLLPAFRRDWLKRVAR